jgi:hypothetical protein
VTRSRFSTKPPPPLAGVSEIRCLCFTFSCSRRMTLSGTILFDKVREGKHGVLRAEDQNLPPENTGLQRNTLDRFSSILDTVGALAKQREKLRASSFLIVEYALDGETGGARPNPKSCSRTKAEISICRAAH